MSDYWLDRLNDLDPKHVKRAKELLRNKSSALPACSAADEPEAVRREREKFLADFDAYKNGTGHFPSTAGLVKAMREAGMLPCR